MLKICIKSKLDGTIFCRHQTRGFLDLKTLSTKKSRSEVAWLKIREVTIQNGKTFLISPSLAARFMPLCYLLIVPFSGKIILPRAKSIDTDIWQFCLERDVITKLFMVRPKLTSLPIQTNLLITFKGSDHHNSRRLSICTSESCKYETKTNWK
jgi:hypothetical protein